MSDARNGNQSWKSDEGTRQLEQVRSASARGTESVLGMAAEHLTSVLSVPFDAYLCWKLVEDSKKASEAHRRGGTSDAERAALKKMLSDDVDLVDFSRQIKQTASQAVKEGLKNAALFLRGKTGLWGTAGLFVLDEWKPAETRSNQVCDMALGAAKGAGMRAVFRQGAHIDPCMRLVPMQFNLPLRATILGITSRVTSTGLSRSTWVEPSNGRMDVGRGVGTVASCAMNPLAVCADAATFGISAGLSKGLNKVTSGGVDRSPLLSSAILGGGFGFSAGAGLEALRQKEAGEKWNFSRIAAGGLIQGAVDAATAIPGGRQAEKEALRIYNNLNLSSEPAKVLPDWLLKGSRPGNARGATSDSEHREGSLNRLSGPDASSASHPMVALKINSPREEPLLVKFGRLVDHTSRIENIDKPNPAWSGKTSCHVTYLRNAVISEPEPVRLYKLSGHDTQLMIPEVYAQALVPVRRQRLLSEIEARGDVTKAVQELDANYKDRALPEDLVPILDGLPNSKIVKRIELLDNPCAYNQWFSVTAAGTALDRTITLYKPSNDRDLRKTTNHEWAHVLHNVRPKLLERYTDAVRLEGGLQESGYNLRDYARTNEKENWAVNLGEGMLDFSAAGVLQFGRNAPLRASVLGRALKASLSEGEQAEKSLFRKQYEARADFIEQKFRPLGLSSLLAEMQRSDEPSIQQLELLKFLGNDSCVPALKLLALKARTQEVADSLIDCGVELLKAHPHKQYEFLRDMSARDQTEPGHRAAAAALRKFTPEQIDGYYKPELSKLERRFGPSNENVAQRSHKLAEWYQLHDQFDEAESYARRAHQTYTRLFGQASDKTCAAASVLANSLEAQGRHADALPFRIDSLEATIANHGKYDRSVRRQLHDLATLYERLGRLDDQETCLMRLLEHSEREFGHNARDAKPFLRKLSEICSRRCDFDRALDFERRADAIEDEFGET